MTQGQTTQLPGQGKPISLGKASKKYGVPEQTLSRWAKHGELTILTPPGKRGQAMLVDEASLVMAIISRRRRYNTGPVEIPALREEAPAPARHTGPMVRTAEVVEKYHHYGETIGFKPLTLEKHRQVLRVFAEKCPLLPLTPDPILNFIHDLKVGQRTKKKYYEVIRQLYNYLQDFQDIPSPLTKRMVPRVERHPYARVLSREDVLRLINAAENFQERMMLEVLYCTRIRADELATLTSENLHNDYIVVTGKTGTREVPINQDLHDTLLLLGEGRLFRDRSGKSITRDGVYQRVQKCMKAIGIEGKKLGPHTLRHTSLTHLYEDTGDLLLVQEAAGHADLETTMIYTHPQAAKQRDRLRQLDPMKRLGPVKQPGPGQADDPRLAAILRKEVD